MCNNNQETNRIRKVFKIIGMVLGGIVAAGLFALVFGLLFRELWNWLMPAIFGLGKITYWQAVGLFILAKLLFSGFHGHGDSCGKEFKKEFGKEFGKEFKKEFGNEFKSRMWAWHCNGHLNETEIGKYDEYWKSEGESAFRNWMEKKQERGE